jgi:hypothetical protein
LTSAEIPARRGRWLRAIGYGLLAEISTILTIIAIVMIYRYVLARGLTDAAYTAFGEQVGAVVGIAGGALYTFIFARLLMRRLRLASLPTVCWSRSPQLRCLLAAPSPVIRVFLPRIFGLQR